MSDRRPIGVFDSGLGGLTAVREISTLLPQESVIYFGDTARVPYGTRSPETILSYARQDVAFLRSFDIKAVVVACGTVSTTALPALEAESALPLVGVVQPAAEAAAQVTKTGNIGLIATEASVRSGAYVRAIAALRPDAAVTAQACPLLVPMVENGRVHRGDRVIELLVSEYLAPLKAAGVDTLILGCTHFPLLKEVVAAFMGGEVALVDPGREAARHLERLLEPSSAGEAPSYRYFVSDSVEQFSRQAGLFLGTLAQGSVEKVDVASFG